ALSPSLPTALILLDNQAAFAHPSGPASARSNPLFEVNLTSLLAAFRVAHESNSKNDNENNLEVIHIFHTSDNPASPLHPQHPMKLIRPLDFARPLSKDKANGDGGGGTGTGETVVWKSLNSKPIGPELEAYLRQRGFRQLLFAGLTTDHCVSTTVRVAANLGLAEPGRIIVVADATAAWAKGGVDADTVHNVSIASLEGEFAEIMGTEDVVKALRRM
ncbi:putative isochorismatase family hydrolase, partial [Aspergillus glaucus CBS 516.65]